VQHTGSFGATFQQQIDKLCGKDWYRLRRIMEVAYTLKEDGQSESDTYKGTRQGGLKELGYDVRCFFLCPNDRMAHTKVIDQRCEQMILKGLITETTDLAVSGRLPDMATKAIGYRQTLDYLGRDGPKMDDSDAFEEYLNEFTTATRRYAKKQMQWFRKDQVFVFVPMDLSKTKAERVQFGAEEMKRLLAMSREEYDRERLDQDSLSAQTRKTNEAQGKKMKTYQFQRYCLVQGSEELVKAMEEADACTQRYQAKKPRIIRDTAIR
jgi:tRNA dimethylallyltransferase